MEERTRETSSSTLEPEIPLSDAIQRACEGDPNGFIRLYEHYKRPLGRRLLYLVGNQEVAYDLYQETFIRLWKGLASVAVRNFEAWLYTIARNIAIDYLRREKLLHLVPFPDEKINDSGTYQPLDMLKQASHEENVCEILYLREALEKMPSRYRVCVLLQELWELPQKEIAQTLGISESAVSANVSRGLKRLREVYLAMSHEAKDTTKGDGKG